VPTVRRSRTIAAPLEDLWTLICDPHHLPRWWPRVERVEDVDGDAFTEVMKTRKGKLVRADYAITERDAARHTVTWAQQVQGTPFAHVLSSAETQLWLAPAAGEVDRGHSDLGAGPAPTSEVTIELRQSMVRRSEQGGVFMGMAPRLGGVMVRRAAAATLDEALNGLERLGG
jgi:uncharacterized protein YndB with AHSA1/START domain